MPDLHAEFSDPQTTESSLLEEFLDEVDRVPSIQNVHAAMRRALGLRPRMRVLDVGCGTGLEVARLAREHPDVTFTGLDQNEQLLAAARRRASQSNIEWIHSALETASLPERHFDVIRTERVLMYSPDPLFGRLLDRLIRLLRPGLAHHRPPHPDGGAEPRSVRPARTACLAGGLRRPPERRPAPRGFHRHPHHGQRPPHLQLTQACGVRHSRAVSKCDARLRPRGDCRREIRPEKETDHEQERCRRGSEQATEQGTPGP